MVSDAPLEHFRNAFVSRLHTNDEKINSEHMRGALGLLLIRYRQFLPLEKKSVLLETGALVVSLALEHGMRSRARASTPLNYSFIEHVTCLVSSVNEFILQCWNRKVN